MKKILIITVASILFCLLYIRGVGIGSRYVEDPFIIPAISNICGEESKAWRIPYSVNLPKVELIPGADIPDKQKRDDTLIVFLQRKADDLSWRSFIALNWPADKKGFADSAKCFATSSNEQSVWEYWMPSTEIFVEPGEKAREWKRGSLFWNSRPKNGGRESEMRILGKSSQMTIVGPEDFPVIDKNRRYTFYEVFYNQIAYDYLVQNGLNTIEGQAKYTREWPNYNSGLTYIQDGDTVNIQERFKRAYFPVGSIKDSMPPPNNGTQYIFKTGEGAIIVKSAWMVLDKTDDPSRFHTREVKLPTGEKYTLGLVAMHIAHKVVEATQWTWASFEHLDNSPKLGADGYAVLHPGKDYTYFDEENNVPADYNRPPEKVFQPKRSERKSSQVVTLTEIIKETQKMNEIYHTMIKDANPNSVWLNYQLVGTQWPFDPTLFTSGGEYQPPKLANSLMETYKQSKSNCMGCHKHAKFGTIEGREGLQYNADFIFGLSSAK